MGVNYLIGYKQLLPEAVPGPATGILYTMPALGRIAHYLIPGNRQ